MQKNDPLQQKAAHLHLKDKKHFVEDSNVTILNREDRVNDGCGLNGPISDLHNPLSVIVVATIYRHDTSNPCNKTSEEAI